MSDAPVVTSSSSAVTATLQLRCVFAPGALANETTNSQPEESATTKKKSPRDASPRSSSPRSAKASPREQRGEEKREEGEEKEKDDVEDIDFPFEFNTFEEEKEDDGARPPLVQPYFRLALPWQEAGITTPAIDEWENVPDVEDGRGDDDAEQKKESKFDGEREGGEGEVEKVWSITTTLRADEDTARMIDARSYVVAFLADRYSQGEEDSNGDASTSNAGRLYLELIPIDITPLLDNDVSINLDMSSAPFVAPACFTRLSFTLTLDKPLLSPKMKLSLNPLAITIRCATRLPGVIVEQENPAMQRYVTADDGSHDPFMLMKKYCLPVYTSCVLFSGLAAERLVITPGAIQGQKKIRWNHKTVVLASGIDSNAIAEYLEFQPVTIALHDRDILNDSRAWMRQCEQWQRAVAGGVNAGDDDLAGDIGESAEEKDREDEEGKSGDKERTAGPRDVFDVDQDVWKEHQEKFRQSASKQSRGAATFELGDL